MAALAITLTILTFLVLLIWLSRHVQLQRERHGGFLLTADYADNGQKPLVSVVIAAKDEADNIARCVNSMLDQDYEDFEVIVVNDRSSDDTAAIVERIAAQDERLTLMNVTELPAGWCGKNNAMKLGIGQAKADWICMIDADCTQTSRHSLGAAVQYAIDSEVDMLSVLPNLEMSGFWENVVQPVCGGLMMIWFKPDHVNDPHRPEAYANGAFMLIRRDAYEQVGGHDAVRDQVNEDMHMARLVKEHGRKLRVVRNSGLYLVRMYTSLGAIVRGWARIFYGTFGTLRRLTLTLAALLLMSLLPYATFALGLALSVAGSAPRPLAIVCAAVGLGAMAMQLSVIYRFRRLIDARPDLFWTYPIGCSVATACVLLALTKLRPGAHVTWRNTTYTRPAKGHG